MRFVETPIDGLVVVDLEPIGDDRGFFARGYSRDAFSELGLMSAVVDANISLNHRERTLRGMHYQAAPHPDPKLVRCTGGELFDVAVDLRSESPTYLDWYGTTLTAANRRAMYVPPGCAHGFMTLAPDTEVFYLMGERFHSDLARGVRWDDPAFGIEWPETPLVISERDAGFPDFAP